MKQVITGAPADKSSSHPRAAAATVADVVRPPLTPVRHYDHAAAYLMKHAGTTALIVTGTRTGQPADIITQAGRTLGTYSSRLEESRVYAGQRLWPGWNVA